MKNKNEQISELTELNEELENYFANTIIPQLFVDADLTLRKFTPPAMSQFSLSPDHIGMPLDQVREHFRFPTFIENIKYVIETGKILEKEIQTTDMRWYQMNILPYHVRKENRTNGVIITFVDITSRIRDIKEHEKLIAEHELLLDTIVHDIKNPIFALDLSVRVLKGAGTSAAQQAKLLNNVETSMQEIKKIINGLSESHWKPQKHDASEELLDLQNILEDVRISLAPQILESNAKITYHIGISEVTFVRRKLRSIMYNLISNAIKYTPSSREPLIHIKTEEVDGFMVIRVTDNGIGIKEEHRMAIFEKFKRASSTVEGSGVGLYLVNTIVINAGGKITVDSVPGEGSTFNVFLKLNEKVAD